MLIEKFTLYIFYSIFQDDVEMDNNSDMEADDLDFQPLGGNDDDERRTYNKQAFLQAIECGLRYGLSYNQICAMINR